MTRFLAALALLLAASQPLTAEDLQPIKLKFPLPKITGTPVPIKLPNLESANAPLPTVLAPPEAVNLAADRPVTSSDAFPIIGELSFITDGDKKSEEGYFVELGPGLQWVQIDLGAAAKLYGIGLWHFHSQARAYRAVIVQVSDDPEFKNGVTTLFNNDHDDSAGLGAGKDPAYIERNRGRLIDARGTVARHVRLYSKGNTSDDLNHYVEVEVFGVTVK